MCYELLRCCNSRLYTIRMEACITIYFLMKANYESTKRQNFARVRLQVCDNYNFDTDFLVRQKSWYARPVSTLSSSFFSSPKHYVWQKNKGLNICFWNLSWKITSCFIAKSMSDQEKLVKIYRHTSKTFCRFFNADLNHLLCLFLYWMYAHWCMCLTGKDNL